MDPNDKIVTDQLWSQNQMEINCWNSNEKTLDGRLGFNSIN